MSKQHRETVGDLVGKNALRAAYPLRNSRHHWAVRAMRAGTPAQIVASQLGHGSVQLVHNTYGRFVSATTDRDTWETRVSQHEEERRKAVAATMG